MKRMEKSLQTSNAYCVPQDKWVELLTTFICGLNVVKQHITNDRPQEALQYIENLLDKVSTARECEMRVDEFMTLVMNRLNYFETKDL